jgi:hypothetical protein
VSALPVRAPLERLAVEIRHDIEAADQHWQNAVKHAIRAGEGLIEAKALLQHGEWLPWLSENFAGFSARSASSYMRLARNGSTVADLTSIRQAVAALTTPKDDPKDDDQTVTLDPGLAPEPKREDFGDGDLAELHYLSAVVDWRRDRQIAYYRAALRACAEAFADPDPIPGWPVGRVTALMLRATTGIAYIEAERAYESAEGADFDAVHAAYVAHEEAKT